MSDEFIKYEKYEFLKTVEMKVFDFNLPPLAKEEIIKLVWSNYAIAKQAGAIAIFDDFVYKLMYQLQTFSNTLRGMGTLSIKDVEQGMTRLDGEFRGRIETSISKKREREMKAVTALAMNPNMEKKERLFEGLPPVLRNTADSKMAEALGILSNVCSNTECEAISVSLSSCYTRVQDKWKIGDYAEFYKVYVRRLIDYIVKEKTQARIRPFNLFEALENSERVFAREIERLDKDRFATFPRDPFAGVSLPPTIQSIPKDIRKFAFTYQGKMVDTAKLGQNQAWFIDAKVDGKTIFLNVKHTKEGVIEINLNPGVPADSITTSQIAPEEPEIIEEAPRRKIRKTNGEATEQTELKA